MHIFGYSPELEHSIKLIKKIIVLINSINTNLVLLNKINKQVMRNLEDPKDKDNGSMKMAGSCLGF